VNTGRTSSNSLDGASSRVTYLLDGATALALYSRVMELRRRVLRPSVALAQA
jgi:hypothetical protein